MKLKDFKRKPLVVHVPPTRLLIDIRALRMARGVGLRQAANVLGITYAILGRIELGSTPKLDTALKIAAFVDMPVEKVWALKAGK